MSFVVPTAMYGRPYNQFLLDLYPGAAAAYSLRVLSSDFKNAAIIRVRRSSDSAESDFTASEITDGTLTAWTGANDGFVRTWYDQSGNDRHATQATAGSQPMIVNAGSLVTDGDGLPSIDWDGIDDYLEITENIYASVMTIFLAATQNTEFSNNFQRFIHFSDGSNSLQLTRNRSPNYNLLTKDAWQSGTANLDWGSFPGKSLISAMFEAVATELYLNGTEKTSSAGAGLGAGNQTKSMIAVRDDLVSSTFFSGQMSELIPYPSNQSANRPTIESSIAAAWGITLP